MRGTGQELLVGRRDSTSGDSSQKERSRRSEVLLQERIRLMQEGEVVSRSELARLVERSENAQLNEQAITAYTHQQVRILQEAVDDSESVTQAEETMREREVIAELVGSDWFSEEEDRVSYSLLAQTAQRGVFGPLVMFDYGTSVREVYEEVSEPPEAQPSGISVMLQLLEAARSSDSPHIELMQEQAVLALINAPNGSFSPWMGRGAGATFGDFCELLLGRVITQGEYRHVQQRSRALLKDVVKLLGKQLELVGTDWSALQVWNHLQDAAPKCLSITLWRDEELRATLEFQHKFSNNPSGDQFQETHIRKAVHAAIRDYRAENLRNRVALIG